MADKQKGNSSQNGSNRKQEVKPIVKVNPLTTIVKPKPVGKLLTESANPDRAKRSNNGE